MTSELLEQPQEEQRVQQQRRHSVQLPHALRSLLDSAGAGFVYGAMFGSIVAGFEGVRASPSHQRLRGALYHMKAEVPRTAGRIAMVTCLFRATALTLEKVRGHESNDLWDVVLAAPLAGALIKARHGPKAALHSAFLFGSVGAIMVVFHEAETKVARHKHHDAAHEVLEEIAFAEEIDD
ncbi:Mitochondrial import inner membrane translocase subunit tim17-b, partial [Globisporangium splendens]